MATSSVPDPIRGNRRALFGWAMYDWANSAYVTTVAVAILPIYFASVVVPEGGAVIGGTRYAADTLWGLMVSSAALFVFLAAPTLGAIADFTSAKKRFLLSFCYTGVVSGGLLFFVGSGDVLLTIVLFVVSQIGFVGANVFYDAFLPDVSPEGQEDRISSRGFAFGYVGGGLQFGIALALVSMHARFGLSESLAARIGMLMAILWWGGFALFTVFLLREPRRARTLPPEFRRYPLRLGYIALGFARVWRTSRRVGRLRHLLLFLIAYMIYNDGIQTVINMATIYGKQELHLPATALMTTLLVIQFIAFVGALLFARLAERIGARRAVLVALVAWSGIVTYAYFIDSTVEFFALGVGVGLVLGGSQSLSRSLYSTMIPPSASAEFFAFYSVFNKFSSIWGPAVFALVRHWSGSSRNAILSIIVFFVLGFVLLAFVNEDEARRASAELPI